MGANTSQDPDDREFGFNQQRSYHLSMRTPMPQGKPDAPEGYPQVSDVTHNSLTLTWFSSKGINSSKILAYQLECCNLKERKWKVITSTCQGTSYHVRNLTPNTKYMFRVRAENVCGQGKPSMCSDIVETKNDYTVLTEKSVSKLVRRHSNYIHFDGGLNTLLKHSEKVEDSSSVGTIPFKRSSMRMTMPATFRKRTSVTSMMPGAMRESVCSLKDSQKCVEESSVTEEEGLNIKRISVSTTGSSNLSATSMSSIPEEEELKMFYDRTDCKDVCSDTDSSVSTSNSSPGTKYHNTILTAPLSDDTKLAYVTSPDRQHSNKYLQKGDRLLKCNNTCCDLYCKEKVTDQDPVWHGRNQSTPQGYKNMPDLRSLREILNSQDVMVKTHDFDNNCVCSSSCSCERHNYCAIKEIEEEENIALDIESTI